MPSLGRENLANTKRRFSSPMLLLAASSQPALASPLQPQVSDGDSVFPGIVGGSACDEDSPIPGTCNCSGMPMGPESWRISKPDWFLPNVTSVWNTTASLFGQEVPLSQFMGHKATLVMNIASA